MKYFLLILYGIVSIQDISAFANEFINSENYLHRAGKL